MPAPSAVPAWAGDPVGGHGSPPVTPYGGREQDRMTPGGYQAPTELVREALARAQDTAWRSAEIQATTSELTVIAEDLRSRARAGREHAQELASKRLRRV